MELAASRNYEKWINKDNRKLIIDYVNLCFIQGD